MPRSSLFLMILCSCLLHSSHAAAAQPAYPRDFSFSLPLYSPGSAWQQKAVTAPVLSSSDRQILQMYRELRGDNSDLMPPGSTGTTWPFMDINVDDFSIPIFRAAPGTQSVGICDYNGVRAWPGPKFGPNQKLGGPVNVPKSTGPVRPAGPQDRGADGHLVLYNPATSLAYDFWQLTTQRSGPCASLGGGFAGPAILETGAVDYSDTYGEGVNPDGVSSARSCGAPLLAGMILPEDVENRVIAHPLAFVFPALRNLSPDPESPLASDYFYPAASTETDFYSTNADSLAAGQRIRLKKNLVDDYGDPLDWTQLAPITRMFLTALQNYGAILVDGANGFSFYAEDSHTAVLHLSDAEVNGLIGQPPGTPLDPDMTKWQIVMDQLNLDLEAIPFAYGPWSHGQDPATAAITYANFEVVAPAVRPGASQAGPYLLLLGSP